MRILGLLYRVMVAGLLIALMIRYWILWNWGPPETQDKAELRFFLWFLFAGVLWIADRVGDIANMQKATDSRLAEKEK